MRGFRCVTSDAHSVLRQRHACRLACIIRSSVWCVQDGYHFESGPSLYSGMAARGRAANPLSHVMQAIGESLDLIEYNCWNLVLASSSHCVSLCLAAIASILVCAQA